MDFGDGMQSSFQTGLRMNQEAEKGNVGPVEDTKYNRKHTRRTYKKMQGKKDSGSIIDKQDRSDKESNLTAKFGSRLSL